MRDMEKLCGVIEEELHKIASKGLNTSNLDTAYKLVDMYKDLKNTEYWEGKLDYYMNEMDGYSQEGYSQRYSRNEGYNMGHSERRKRDRMGRYSRNDGSSYENGESLRRGYSRNSYADGGYSGYDRYMDSKESYRSSKTPECKQRLMQTLEEYMDDFTEQMEEMLRDSDCQEERETIKRYISKIKNLS